MKKKLVLLITLFFLIFVKPVDAHFLATDKNIGAVLHVDPNDEPVAGSQTSFFFEFKDKQNKFDPKNCDCTFVISENGKDIFSQLLFQNSSNPSLSNASVFYTFPQKDVYQLKVVGKPQSSNSFQPFTLTWDFRVDQQSTNQNQSGQSNSNFLLAHYSHFIIIFLGVIVFIVLLINKSPKILGQN